MAHFIRFALASLKMHLASLDTGGVIYDPITGQVLSADTLVLPYLVANPSDGSLFDYEKFIIDNTVPEKLNEKYPNLEMQRLTSQSFDAEVVKLVADDMPLFVGAIMIITVFLALTFGKLNANENR